MLHKKNTLVKSKKLALLLFSLTLTQIIHAETHAYFPSSTEWEKRDYYVLFPGASSKLRQWPIGSFAEIANRIYSETCLTGILDGAPNEKILAESIRELSDSPLEWADLY